jgi:hypothetical protein
MPFGDISALVAQCAKAVLTGAGCRYRPASIHAVTVQVVGAADVVVWVVTSDPTAATGLCYRFCLRRIDTFSRPICCFESLAKVKEGKIVMCTYRNIPGNVRDIGLTAGKRALRLPWDA